jgi:2,3-bisphosphoglycerate-dependent phosphoglycerate mutase
MICKLFVFRHAETYDNCRRVFSGWRDSKLTPKGFLQALEIARQLRHCKIDYAFTSHLKRARQTLSIVLEAHPLIPVFLDDRLIERCYGLLQGRSKKRVAHEDPEFYAQFYRGYSLAPPEGESLEMVEKRVMSFFDQLRDWLKQNLGNVVISCHNNSIRPFRRVFENLSLTQMCRLENPQDMAMVYELDLGNCSLDYPNPKAPKPGWKGELNPKYIKLATDPRNQLRKYY